MDQRLQDAFAVLLPELRRTSGLRPIVEDSPATDHDGEEVVNVVFLNQDRRGQGILARDGDWPHQLALIADQMQEWAVEELWEQGRSTAWPECPLHPDSHPLKPVVMDGTALWQCPKTGAPIAALGNLP